MKRIFCFFELIVFILIWITLSSCAQKSPFNPSINDNNPDPIVTDDILFYSYKIINEFPHDHGAFTQGLVFENDYLYEGTGRKGRSSLRRVNIENGKILDIINLEQNYFGEGITIFQDKIYQLTWLSHTGFIYDKTDFLKIRDFNYPTEGWGITHNRQYLIMSDGSSNLYVLNPESMERIETISVRYQNETINRLNELEYIQGRVFANIWQTNNIVVINPLDGQVTNWIDLSGLLNPGDYSDRVDVLNGIAFDSENSRLFVTGKLWPKLFEIILVPQN